MNATSAATTIKLAPTICLPPALVQGVDAVLAAPDSIAETRTGFEIACTQLDALKRITECIDAAHAADREYLKALSEWMLDVTDPVFLRSPFAQRARTWPLGYPGDYLTLESVYRNEPGGIGAGQVIDRYFLSRTLAVAVRSRLRMLARLLNERAATETGDAKWLNLAAGSCHELLAVGAPLRWRTFQCVDADANALDFARKLLAERRGNDTLAFERANAFRFANAQRNRERYGAFTTIYSAGFFDYVENDPLARLIKGLYGSLADGGVLIAPFKDASRYSIFDHQWLLRWHHFLQRREEDFRTIFTRAGISGDRLDVQRDESGVILFFIAQR